MRDFKFSENPAVGMALIFGVTAVALVLAVPLALTITAWFAFATGAAATPDLLIFFYWMAMALLIGFLAVIVYGLTSEERFSFVVIFYMKGAFPTFFALAGGGLVFGAFPAEWLLAQIWPLWFLELTNLPLDYFMDFLDWGIRAYVGLLSTLVLLLTTRRFLGEIESRGVLPDTAKVYERIISLAERVLS